MILLFKNIWMPPPMSPPFSVGLEHLEDVVGGAALLCGGIKGVPQATRGSPVLVVVAPAGDVRVVVCEDREEVLGDTALSLVVRDL
eukprot:1130210-Pyramimonas_sp.AAC.1